MDENVPVVFASRVEAAMFYAGMGFYVFPLHWIRDGKCSCGKQKCDRAGKHPITPNGLKDAVNDKQQIAVWWHQYPDANIGIRTGHESGIFVIDLDVGNGKNGIESLEELNKIFNNGRKNTPTARQRTGSGGLHLIYRYPPELTIHNRTGLTVNGRKYRDIDVRGDNGYIVAAPSNHISGGVYQWYNNPIVDCAQWLIDIITASDSAPGVAGNSQFTSEQIKQLGDAILPYWGTDQPEEATDHRTIIEGFSILSKRNGIDVGSVVQFILEFDRSHPCADGKIHDERDARKLIEDCYSRDYDIRRDFPDELKKRLTLIIGDTTYISYEWAPHNRVLFDRKYGTFSWVEERWNERDGEWIPHTHPLVQIPIQLNGVVMDYDTPKIDATFLGKRYVADINTIASRIAVDQRTSRSHMEMIMMFLTNYLSQNVINAREYHSDPVWIDSEGIIHVEWLDADHNIQPWPDFSIPEILTTLHDLWRITTNPDAFVRVMAWSIFAPYSYFSRLKRIPVPFKALSGITEGAKTEMAMLFVSEGYNQDSGSVLIGENQIETKFTEMEQLGRSILPAVFDDLSVQYLQKRESFFKNIYLGTKAGTRGRSDQSVNEYPNKRNFILTINDEMQVSRAQTGRYDIELFTKEHAERQNIAEYTRLKAKLPQGFMLALNREIFNGRNFDDVLTEMRTNIKHRTEWNRRITSYCLDEINKLCGKYELPPFASKTANVDTGLDHFTLVCEYILEQYHRYKKADLSERVVYAELGETEIDVDEPGNNIYVVWFTTTAFRKIKNKLQLPYETVKDFINSYSDGGGNQNITIVQAESKWHKMLSQTAARAYAISYELVADSLQTIKN